MKKNNSLANTSPTVIRSSGGTLILTGPINFNTVMKIYHQGLYFINKHLGDIVVDLKDISNGDSSILALLSAWIRYTITQQKQIRFIHLPESLKHLMQLSGLEMVFPI
jgi:ABC-type transporter Mla MlaB component